jgi:hypothetical protein
MIKPISPEDLVMLVPDFVIEAVNELIIENWNGREARITQDSIIGRIISKESISRDEIYRRNLLNFEPIFEEAGWEVTYDKPGYCESYKAYFLFKKK